MSDNKKKKFFTQEQIMSLLDTLYSKVLDGIPHVSKPIEELAEEYLNRARSKKDAAKKMIDIQVAKCTTSGVITGFGGIVTLPITIPADIASVLYVEMRMIACAAYMGGYDVKEDVVQAFVYSCLAGVSIMDIIKQAGLKFGEKIAVNLIKKIPGKAIAAINKKVGFRFITKFGQKGIVNLGKMVPVVGAAISGALDFAESRYIGNRAYRWFLKNDFSDDKRKVNNAHKSSHDKNSGTDVIDVEVTELD